MLDLTESEIKQLAEVTENATCTADLDAVAEVVGRLRLDGKFTDMATFEALMLRAENTAAPLQLDWQRYRAVGSRVI